MSFLNCVRRNTPKTERVIVYGESGLGKTTFATSAPNPIVIQTEDGLGEIDVPCFPLAESYLDVMKALDSLANENHDFKTVVIDSLDWLETLIWKQVCTDNKVSSIEKIGYGRGYNEALVFWSYFFDELNKCRDKGMLVIMTAHSQVNKVEDPEHLTFDQHDLKLHKKAAALCREFADVIGYASLKKIIKVTEGKGFNDDRNRAITTGERILNLSASPAYVAKNRYNMASSIPLLWSEFAKSLPSQK